MSHADWRLNVRARFPHLFAKGTDGNPIGGYPEVEDGWRSIVEIVLARLSTVAAGYPAQAVTVAQIKSKFGGIRIYLDTIALPDDVDARVQDAVDRAEFRSLCTCEVCGDEGTLHNRSGWLSTRCRTHAIGTEVPLRGGENILVRYMIESPNVKRIVSRKRYERDRDVFIDLPIMNRTPA